MGVIQSNTCLNDNTFGPTVKGCRDNFDFTVVFEQSFFSITPSVLFLTLAALRILHLSRQSTRIEAGKGFRAIKLATSVLYAALQLSLLILTSAKPTAQERTSIAAAALSFMDTILFCGLSSFEHSRSLRPSILFNTYLFFSLLFDIVQVRTLWLVAANSLISRLFTAAIGIKVAIFLLETKGKSRWMRPEDQEKSPEERSGVFNISVFAWLNRLLVRGSGGILLMQDLYPLDERLVAEVLHARFWSHWETARSNGKRFRLSLALAKTLQWHMLLPIPFRLAFMGFSFCQPFLINGLIGYLETKDSNPNFGYGYIGASVIVYVGIAISSSFYWYYHLRALHMIRGCLTPTIFKTTTELNIIKVDNSAAVTLMGNDVERIQGGFRDLHEFWANAIEVGLASWLLERELGIAFLVPIALVLLCIVCSVGLGSFTNKRQKMWMVNIQKRVGLTADVISNMKSLKIFGLTEQMGDFIQGLRITELQSARRFRFLTLVSTIVAFTPLLLSPVITFAATSRNLDTTRIFTSLSYLLLLSNPLTQLFQSIPNIMASFACLDRVEEFLEPGISEKDSCHSKSGEGLLPAAHHESRLSMGELKSKNSAVATVHGERTAITIQNGDFGWEDEKIVLHDINLSIPKAQLTMIVGPIASGKTTLCHAILGELPVVRGQITFHSVVRPSRYTQSVFARNAPFAGFCDQKPFLKNTSIVENIVGHSSPLDRQWYTEVLAATALDADLSSFPAGDETIVGTGGEVLSGGQRQRVCLARAIYLKADLVILDDVLSGLDENTQEHVFRMLLEPTGLLRQQRSTVVLCTHSINYLRQADHIIALGNDGRVIEEGTFDALVANEKYVHSLNIQSRDFQEKGSPRPQEPDVKDQKVSEGAPQIPDVEDKARQVGDMTVYLHYFSILGFSSMLLFVTFGAAFGALFNYSTVWLQNWANSNENQARGRGNGYYLGIFTALRILCLVVLGVFVGHNTITMVVRSGTRLHKQAISAVMSAPMTFFYKTDSGTTINRFSEDISLIGSDLAYGMSNTGLSGFMALGQAAVIAVASPHILIGYPILLIILYSIQNFYLKTSRQMRFLDLEAKAPLYTHFLETLTGLATIRAHGWVNASRAMNSSLLDKSQQPAYLLSMMQQWLALTLNLTVAAIAIALVALVTQLHSSSGFTGVGLVSLMSFGEMLSAIVRSWTQLETAIGAVARLKSFNEKVKSENLPEETEVPPEDWPQKGVIDVERVSASYSDEPGTDTEKFPLVIRGLKLSIAPGEKLAVCGRTGSGKSSLLLLFLRLLSPTSDTAQNMKIDNVPLHLVHRATLRSRIIAVPQSPFFPNGSSFRWNIDPQSIATTSECEEVLRKVQLWDACSGFWGLDKEMISGSLSQGQKQLFWLGRAVLRARLKKRNGHGEGGVVLFDEVTSNVDRETELRMQQIIMEEFSSYTVIASAHRLDTVLDFDKVLVMENGEMQEMGESSGIVTVRRKSF